MKWLATIVLGLSLMADECGAGPSMPPDDGGGPTDPRAPDGPADGESMSELELKLDKLVSRHSNLVTASNEDPSKCESLCELSRAICEVKGKMCDIAEDRVTDDDYQNLCRKAKQRCSEASDSCVRCVGRNDGRGAGVCGDGEAGE